jgi:hypothetical protein
MNSDKYYVIYSEQEKGFWNDKDGWGAWETASVYPDTDSLLPSIGVPDARWVEQMEAATLIDDPEEVPDVG